MDRTDFFARRPAQRNSDRRCADRASRRLHDLALELSRLIAGDCNCGRPRNPKCRRNHLVAPQGNNRRCGIEAFRQTIS